MDKFSVNAKLEIAIVDDETAILENLTDLLQDEGIYVVRCFASPEEAFESLRDNPPDLLITDISMPNMGGLELISALRQIVPDLPAVVLSGYLDLANVTQALKLGVSDVIEKPYRDYELLEVAALGAAVGRARKRVTSLLKASREVEAKDALSELYRAQKLLLARVF